MTVSALESYCQKVVDGREVACKKVKKTCEKLLTWIHEPYRGWHFDIGAAERPIKFIEAFCKVPAGKLGQPMHLEEYQKAWIEAAFGFVDREGNRRFQEVFVTVGRKNGKALSLDTKIPTADGWKTMGDVHVGDSVYGQDGRLSSVIAESEIFHKPMYLVEFEDGSAIKASADHIWTVQTKKSRAILKYKPKSHNHRWVYEKLDSRGYFDTTTEDMAKDFAHLRKDGAGTEYKYRVPMCEPIQYPHKELPIDPYVLGVWLGDGTSTKPEITCSDEDIDDMMYQIAAHGYSVDARIYKSETHDKHKAWHILIDHRQHGKGGDPNSFRNTLKSMGLLGNKHIPEEYMTASVSQRVELLRGLMDTDGYCSKKGQCQLVQKGEHLTEQVWELLASLGIKSRVIDKEAKCNGKPAGTVYQLTFFCDREHSPFHLGRKSARLKDHLAPRMTNKSIVNITRIADEPSKCIAIDNDSHLYLAGRGYTATHNTSLSAAIELYMLIADHEGAPQIYNAANSEDQAKLAFNAAMRMRAQSPDLKKVTKKRTDDLYCENNFGVIKPLSKNTDALDGLDVYFGVMDEVHAMKNREVYDLLRQGMSAREQPMIWEITTNGFTRNGFFDEQYEKSCQWLDGKMDDDRFLPWVYELDDREEWTDPHCWKKANPGLGTIKKLSYLEDKVAEAKDNRHSRPSVLTKDFDMPQNASQAWLDYEEAVNPQTFDIKKLKPRYGVCGFDASDCVDLTAAQMMFMVPGDDHIYEKSMYWIPEDVILADMERGRKERDGVPYQQWIERGLMRTVPGNKIDKRVLVEWLKELMQDEGLYPFALGYDPWHMTEDYLKDELKTFMGANRVVEVRQGAKTLSGPMKQIKADYGINRIVDNHNPINEWCRMNVQIRTDVNFNIQPTKKDGYSKNRIDGWAAEIDAYITLNNMFDDYMAYI